LVAVSMLIVTTRQAASCKQENIVNNKMSPIYQLKLNREYVTKKAQIREHFYEKKQLYLGSYQYNKEPG
jgi:hypothetical protein